MLLQLDSELLDIIYTGMEDIRGSSELLTFHRVEQEQKAQIEKKKNALLEARARRAQAQEES